MTQEAPEAPTFTDELDFTDELQGLCALVWGGAMGIGEASARLLLQRGAHITVADLDTRAADAWTAPWRALGRCQTLACDVRRSGDPEAAVAAHLARFGRLDAAINSAGIQRYGTLETTTDDAWDEVMDVNLRGAFRVARASIGALRAARGSLVLVASVQSLGSQPGALAYATSKHGLLGLTRAAAVDHAPQGVRVNCVCPGSVDTPMLHWAASLDPQPSRVLEDVRRMHPLGRVATAAEVAEVIVFLAGPRSSFVTGAAYVVDGGLTVPFGGAPHVES